MSEERWDVVVIGAGFSGLTAARDLSEQGRRVLVLEGRDRPGGRTWYRNFADTDHLVEMGGTWISNVWMTALMEEVNRYGVELVDQEGMDSFSWATGGEVRKHAPIPPEEFAAAEPALIALHQAFLRTPDGELREGDDYSDLDVPVSEWPPFVALPTATKEFVFAWAAMYAGCGPENVSVMHFSMMLSGFGNNVSALHYGLSQRYSHGTKELINALANNLDVRYNEAVSRIEDTADGVVITTETGTFVAKRVICTVPINSLHRVTFSPELPEAARGMAKKGTTSQSIKSWALCRNVPKGFLGIGWKTGFEWSAEVYRLEDETSLVCSFGVEDNLVNATDIESVQNALRRFEPGIEVIKIDSHDWRADRFADGTSMIVEPGWIVNNDCHAFAAPHGSVYFAGADHSVQWTGWMEGAVRSGKAVSAQVHESL
ncbi:monoamine oxidase [Leucobacter exalbidus]|uniref:Monoamine oxidase n=1 Tax=Leucobacter exalbidus TaxID=662960 RepID=A0A940PMK5_9MICO|nr:NAD(P)/FAD-dependent oxidoreductase [Leucobacter exalbidus]MBP1326707.1 monoamine oxidase [Leucobacter exalbidus]